MNAKERLEKLKKSVDARNNNNNNIDYDNLKCPDCSNKLTDIHDLKCNICDRKTIWYCAACKSHLRLIKEI